MSRFTPAEITSKVSISSTLLAEKKCQKDCAVDYIRTQAAGLFTDFKPACLVSLSNRVMSNGANLHKVWTSHHTWITAQLQEICITVLHTKSGSITLLCYLPEQLGQHLSSPAICGLLQKAGYTTTAPVDNLIEELKQRIAIRGSFPYEIGLFVGYSNNILDYYPDTMDCLTAHLMLESAEVLSGAKPANLLSIVNRTRPCGRNLYQIWQAHYKDVAHRLPLLHFKLLQSNDKSLLLLCYSKQQLEQQVSHTGIRTLLHKAGYDKNASLDELLTELEHRIDQNDRFPHEIGLFIGYPAKDVAAFMGLIKLPFACQGPWKIYGNPAHSLNLAEKHRCCRQRMATILATGSHKALELNLPDHPFYCRTTDNSRHIHIGVDQ